MSRFIFTKFEPNWSKFKFDLTFDLGGLTIGPSNHLTNINMIYLGPSYIHPPNSEAHNLPSPRKRADRKTTNHLTLVLGGI